MEGQSGGGHLVDQAVAVIASFISFSPTDSSALPFSLGFYEQSIVLHIVQNAVFRYSEPSQGISDEGRRGLNFRLDDLGHSQSGEPFRFCRFMCAGQDWNLGIEVVYVGHRKGSGLNIGIPTVPVSRVP